MSKEKDRCFLGTPLKDILFKVTFFFNLETFKIFKIQHLSNSDAFRNSLENIHVF